MKPLTSLIIASALIGPENVVNQLMRNSPYNIGVTSAKPHDPERLKKARERQARRAARRAAN